MKCLGVFLAFLCTVRLATAQQTDTTAVEANMPSVVMDSILVLGERYELSPAFTQSDAAREMLRHTSLVTPLPGVTSALARDMPALVRFYTDEDAVILLNLYDTFGLWFAHPSRHIRLTYDEPTALHPAEDVYITVTPDIERGISLFFNPLRQEVDWGNKQESFGISLLHNGSYSFTDSIESDLALIPDLYSGFAVYKEEIGKLSVSSSLYYVEMTSDFSELQGYDVFTEKSTQGYLNAHLGYGPLDVSYMGQMGNGVNSSCYEGHCWEEDMSMDMHSVYTDLHLPHATLFAAGHVVRSDKFGYRSDYTGMNAGITAKGDFGKLRASGSIKLDYVDYARGISADAKLVYDLNPFSVELVSGHLYDPYGSIVLGNIVALLYPSEGVQPRVTSYALSKLSYERSSVSVSGSAMVKEVNLPWVETSDSRLYGGLYRLHAVLRRPKLNASILAAYRTFHLYEGEMDRGIVPGTSQYEIALGSDYDFGSVGALFDVVYRAGQNFLIYPDRIVPLRRPSIYINAGLRVEIGSFDVGVALANAAWIAGYKSYFAARELPDNSIEYIGLPIVPMVNLSWYSH